ncbi:efflux RND transporter permease subunit [Magnetofaba australis]|uniref:Putative acriflavin resistance protein n=1 Tax=Magnetofaba australis IT-1 TaxID=1434232 RepID=A0A1Y2KA91_9PROT|nr:efflux RND transporter permease subunit [Magnetofaba australis]OSM07638.1 putative acriflavin resistance protein [Magnetofaba australis IT-1]
MMPERLNWPGRLARAFVASRLTPLMAVAILLFGVIGLTFTPREENPQIIVPAAEVAIAFPGHSPTEVEHLLLSPLEAELAAIDGVKNIHGVALDGAAQVMVEFRVGQDPERSLVRLYDRVLGYSLPPGAGEPRIRRIDVDDVPVFTVTLASASHDDHALRRMAQRVLERLRSTPGVGRGRIVGGRSREVRIETTPERLQASGMTLNGLVAALGAADHYRPIDHRVHVGENHSLRLSSRLASVQDVARIVVGRFDGGLVRVEDIADVVDGPTEEPDSLTRFLYGAADSRSIEMDGAGMAAVTVAIAKRPGVNAVDLTAALRQRLATMEKGFLPPGVHQEITRDDGHKADRTVTILVEHLFIAIGAVTLVLWLFLGFRAAAMVAITIPLVFAVVMGMDLLAGPTLNRITLYALILALGMLVDDAIVVAENTHRHFHGLPLKATNEQRIAAAVTATHEIGNPTTLATFTVVLVFLSLTLVSGMLGQYFMPITFNVPVAMIASLIIAYSMMPWLARGFMKTDGGEAGESHGWLERGYRGFMLHLLNHGVTRWLVYLGIFGLLVLALLQPAWQFVRPQGIAGEVSPLGIPLAFLPKDDKNTFLVHIHLPETTPLEITDRAAREVEALLRVHPEVRNLQTHVGFPAVIDFNGQLKGSGGNIGPQFAEVRVNLTDKGSRDRTSIEIVQALREPVARIAARYPGGIIQLVEDPPGPPVRATVLAELYGPDIDRLERLGKRVVEAFRNTWDMAEVWASMPFDVKEYRFSLRRNRIAMAGLTAAQVGDALTMMLAGGTLAHLHPGEEREPVPIRLHIPRRHRVDPDMLERAFIDGPEGRRIPLSELVDVSMTSVPRPIHHKNGERVVLVGGELAASAPVYAVLDLDRRLDGMKLEQGEILETGNLRFNPVRPEILEGYRLLWEGELRLTLDAFRDMGLALGMALAAVFFLLVGYYRRFRLPILAMTVVPLAFIGVFPGHWLLGQSFSAASMVGVIALAGVVVRNSLLIIDFAREYRKKGFEPDASALEAGAVRLRPILLTTLAIVLGTAIMVPDPVFGGLAIALIFGSVSSALFGLVVVPLLYRAWNLKT